VEQAVRWRLRRRYSPIELEAGRQVLEIALREAWGIEYVTCCEQPRPEVLAQRSTPHWFVCFLRCGSCEATEMVQVWKCDFAPIGAALRHGKELRAEVLAEAWTPLPAN
jgi:hypothetical protein